MLWISCVRLARTCNKMKIYNNLLLKDAKHGAFKYSLFSWFYSQSKVRIFVTTLTACYNDFVIISNSRWEKRWKSVGSNVKELLKLSSWVLRNMGFSWIFWSSSLGLVSSWGVFRMILCFRVKLVIRLSSLGVVHKWRPMFRGVRGLTLCDTSIKKEDFVTDGGGGL